MKMWAKFDETTPCNKRQLTYLRRDTAEKLTNKVARFVKSKTIIFYCSKDSITHKYW